MLARLLPAANRRSRKRRQQILGACLTTVYLLTLCIAPLFHTCIHGSIACSSTTAKESSHSCCSCGGPQQQEHTATHQKLTRSETGDGLIPGGLCYVCLFNKSNQAPKVPKGTSIVFKVAAPILLVQIQAAPRKREGRSPANIRAPPFSLHITRS